MKTWIPVKEFSTTNRIVHHVSALGFIAALLLMAYDRYAGSSDAKFLHQSLGMLVFFLYFGRIVLMAWFGKPEAIGNKVEKFLAHMAHLALYGILLLMPLTGLLINLFRGRDTVIFNIITIPGIPETSIYLSEAAFKAHSLLEYACYLLLFAHVGASMFHHFVLKDDTFRRMWGNVED